MIGLAWVALLISEVSDVLKGRVSKLMKQRSSNAKEHVAKGQNVIFKIIIIIFRGRIGCVWGWGVGGGGRE